MGESKRRRDYYSQHPKERLGDAPLEAEYHDKMVAIAQALDEMFNGKIGGPDRGTGFVLMVFPFSELSPGGSSRCNYMQQRCRPARHRHADARNDRPF